MPALPPPTDKENVEALNEGAERLIASSAKETGSGAVGAKRLSAALSALARSAPEVRAKATEAFIPPLKAVLGALQASLQPQQVTLQSLPADLVRYEDPATFIVSLDRFLPSFIDADIQKIWIIDGGLAVTLGRGGADLPPSSEEIDGRNT